jgi:hypothetical protein
MSQQTSDHRGGEISCLHDAKTPVGTMSPFDHGVRENGLHEELSRISRENAQLYEALQTRTVIGQATGLLMARLDLSSDEAFAELTEMASSAQRKVRDVAATVVASANTSQAQAITQRIALSYQFRVPSPASSEAEAQHWVRRGGGVQTSEDAS